ncbi:methionyl-tRNA formyltransferase [Youngiibacter fragilis 232.1]|uniref:Methionyl-tRNA formyltransferase n=1 Tax=Youngiibacter fragilis 232.1 TaxID=994573 RepID=V7I9N4_9CLOT|nr:methionyl-tRNA formyltransferase [Youngiibacter fragilis 232.1]
MDIIFMGTPDFSVPSLASLDDRYGVKLVVAQPDKEKGRGKKVLFPPVKEEALKRGIRVIQPVRLRTDTAAIEEMRAIEPDFIVVVAYGQILSEEVLSIPKYGCINLHASLLPKLRGAAPINWAIIEGHEKSGNTTMLMEKGLDTGPMLLKDEVVIGEKMTAGELHDLLSQRGADLLLRTVEGISKGTIKPEAQDHGSHTYAPMLKKETGLIDWTKDAVEIERLIRGLAPVPGAYSFIGDDQVKILEAKVIQDTFGKPGEITDVSKAGLVVSTGNGSLSIQKVQYPNKKPMAIRDFLNGNRIDSTEFKGGIK